MFVVDSEPVTFTHFGSVEHSLPTPTSTMISSKIQILAKSLATHSSAPPTRHNWAKLDIQNIYNAPLLDLIFRAASVHRRHHDPRKLQLCTLMNIKSTSITSVPCSYIHLILFISWRVYRRLWVIESYRLDPTFIFVQVLTVLNHHDTRPLQSLHDSLNSNLFSKPHAKPKTMVVPGSVWEPPGEILLVVKADLRKSWKWLKKYAEWAWRFAPPLGCCRRIRLGNWKKRKDFFIVQHRTQIWLLLFWKRGLTAYNHNLDTSREFYPSVSCRLIHLRLFAWLLLG